MTLKNSPRMWPPFLELVLTGLHNQVPS